MSEFHQEGAAGLATAALTAPGRLVASLATLFAWLAAAGILFMAAATVYDVFVRYCFNSPTTWATETSTYALIAAVFFGAAYTHLADGNVRIKVVMDRLSATGARDLALITAWIGLIYVAIAGWQATLLVLSDYQHGARIFSLIQTPSWMPKTPIAIGLCLLALALIADIDRTSAGRAPTRRLVAYALFATVAVVLVAFGPTVPVFPGTRYDVGSALVIGAAIAGAFVVNGWRVGFWVLAIVLGSIALFVGGKALGAGD